MVGTLEMKKDIKKLKIAVKGAGWRQQDLAKELNMSRQSLNDWLNKRDMPDELFYKICDVINTEPREFIIDTAPENYVEVPFFAYYSHREERIIYSEEQKSISKLEYGIEDMSDREIRDRYFIYQINKNLSDILRKGGLILFEKLPEPISDLEVFKENFKGLAKIMLLDSGEILRFKDGYFFVVKDNKPVSLEGQRVIAVGRNILNVGL
jgi:transcriptional regulator with XRE-family HTH domain